MTRQCILAALCLYTHPWTFDQYVITLIAFTGLLLVYKMKDGEPVDFRIVSAFLLFQVFAEASKILLLKGASGTSALTNTVLGNLVFDRFWHSAIFGSTVASPKMRSRTSARSHTRAVSPLRRNARFATNSDRPDSAWPSCAGAASEAGSGSAR